VGNSQACLLVSHAALLIQINDIHQPKSQ